MSRLIRYLGAVLAWFWQSKLLFQSVFIIGCVLSYSYLTGPTETSVINGGYILQLLGMLMAIRGLLLVRRYFGHPPLADLARLWCREFPTWNRNLILKPGAGCYSLKGGRANIEVWSPDRPDQPIEQRVESILSNLERLREFQRTSTQRIDEIDEKHQRRHTEHEETLARLGDAIRTDLEAIHTDDILQSLVGLVWVVVGIAITAWPGVIVQLLI